MDRVRGIDQQPAFHACMALVALPLTLWESRAIFQVVARPKLPLLALLLHGGLLVLATKLLLASVRKLRFYRRARALGCGTVPVYPHKDPILGLDLVLQAVPRLKSFTAIQWISERLAKYGTHYHVTLGGEWILLTDEPENIKAMLGTKFEDFPIGGPRLLSTLPILGFNSVFSTNGDAWRHNRAMIRPSFVRDQVADLACFDKHTSNMLRRIPTDGSIFDIQHLLQDMTMDSSSDFLLGYSTNMLTDNPAPGADAFVKAFAFSTEECAKMGRINPLLFKLPHRALDANIKVIREFIRSYLMRAIAEREARIARGEPKKRGYVFLDEMLDEGPSEEYLTDQLLSVMIAGRDTTAMGITGCVWYLARHPNAVKKLRDEIASVGAQNPTWEQLKNMKHLNNIIKESMSQPSLSHGPSLDRILTSYRSPPHPSGADQRAHRKQGHRPPPRRRSRREAAYPRTRRPVCALVADEHAAEDGHLRSQRRQVPPRAVGGGQSPSWVSAAPAKSADSSAVSADHPHITDGSISPSLAVRASASASSLP